MAPLLIREATPADIEGLLPLFDGYLRFYKRTLPVERVRDFIEARFREKSSVIFVAVEGEELAGFTQLYPSFSTLSLRPSFLLNDLFVRESSRGKGLARRLLEAAQAHGQATGCAGLMLQTARTNAAAQALYESAGWKRDEEFLSYVFRT